MKNHDQWHQSEIPFKTNPVDKYKETYEKHKKSAEEFYSHVSRSDINAHYEVWNEIARNIAKSLEKLSKSEFEHIYWTHLAKVGWKIYDEKRIALTCLVCGEPMGFNVDINTIGKMEVSDLPYLKNPKTHIQSHKKQCKGEPNE